MSFYRWAMRKAPLILFVAGIVYFVGSVAFNYLTSTDYLSAYRGNEFPTPMRGVFFLSLFLQPLSAAMLFLFGAGLLWRLDRLPAKTAE